MNNERIFTVNFFCDTGDIGRYQKLVEEFCEFSGISYLNTEIRFPTQDEKDLAVASGIVPDFYEEMQKRIDKEDERQMRAELDDMQDGR